MLGIGFDDLYIYIFVFGDSYAYFYKVIFNFFKYNARPEVGWREKRSISHNGVKISSSKHVLKL